MPVLSFLSAIRKPVASNKKLFGLITIAIIIIGALGASYYYYIQKNQYYIREYKLQTLDFYFEKVTKKLENNLQRIESTGNQIKNENIIAELKKVDTLLLTNDHYIKNDFDEFILRIVYEGKAIAYKSTYHIPGVLLSDSTFQSDRLNLGTVTDLDVMGQEYKLFARRYQYGEKFEIQLLGLIKEDHYNKLTRELDPWVIALLASFLLLCLIGMPFFKILFISEDERLSRRDIIIAGFAVLLGSPIILAVFLSLVDYRNEYYNTIPKQLESIGKQMDSTFRRENELAVEKLINLDLKKYDNRRPIPEGKFYEADEAEDDSLLYSFKYISKTNLSGKNIYSINFIKKPNSVPTDLSQRSYFKDFKASKGVWSIDTLEGINYVMRPVISIENASEEAVYILNYFPTEKERFYKIGSSQLASVHNAILPFGYNFAIIDESGEVWFHSEPGKATLENFFTLSRDYYSLQAAVKGRIDASGHFVYHGQGKRYQVIPIVGTNLSIVTFYDIALLRLKISEILSITSIAIFWAFLFLALICLFTVIFRNPKKRLTGYRLFIFEFLLPKKRHKSKYILLILTFTFFIILTSFIALKYTFLPSFAFIASLLFVIWSYSLVYYSIHPDRNIQKLYFSIRELFLLIAVITLNTLLWLERSEEDNVFFIFILVQLFCLVFFIKPTWKYRRRLIATPIFFLQQKMNFSYQKWYAVFLFTWLLISSVLPTFIFYTQTKNLVDGVWLRTNQFYLTSQYLMKEKDLKKKLPLIGNVMKDSIEAKKFDSLYNYHLSKGFYIDKSYSFQKDQKSIKASSKPSKIGSLLWKSRPIYSEKIRPYQAMAYQGAYDSSWLSMENGVQFLITDIGPKKTAVFNDSSASPAAKGFFEQLLEAGLKIFLTGIILASIFALILFYLEKFFGFGFKDLRPNDFDTDKEYLLKFKDVLQDLNTNSGLILMGPPFTGKGRFAREIVEETRNKKFLVLSFLLLDNLKSDARVEEYFKHLLSGSKEEEEDAQTPKEMDIDFFILEHLEHNFNSFDANRIKLRLISHLIAKKKKVILISEIYPSQILSFYTDEIAFSDSKRAEMSSEYNAWRNILSSFPQVLIGITNTRKEVFLRLDEKPNKEINGKTKKLGKKEEEEKEIKIILAEELGYSNFLPTLAPIIFAKRKSFDLTTPAGFQRMTVHIQNLSHGYYTDIWNSMPSRERYIIYDLAQDGFVNIKNGNSLFSLIKKGLIVWRDRPEIFNNSFRNFIISSVSSAEALHLEIKNRGEGSWGTIRTVLYLIIITIVIFILLGEPDLIQNFETLIGALSGIGVLIPLISSILAKSGQK